MSEIISKELLSAVLGYRINKVSLYNKRNKSINVTGKTEKYCPNTEAWGIYELVHKCKEWAWHNGFVICEIGDTTKVYDRSTKYELFYIQNNDQYNNFIPYDTRLVFKVTQWILDNKVKQCKEN